MGRASLPLLVVLSFAAGCGGSDTTITGSNDTGNFVTNGTFSATVGGAAWSALGRVVVTRPAGSLAIAAASTTYVIEITLVGATKTGTYSLANSVSNASQVIVGNANGMAWVTGAAGATGSVTITTFTSTHVVGTFTFDAVPGPASSATGTLHVTNGAFDLTY